VAWKAASLREAGTHIMGRTTYEQMASARPDRSSQVSERNRHPRLPAETGEPMRTLHFGLRVADLDRSLAFYAAADWGE
jgi:dihydrofolate reductase